MAEDPPNSGLVSREEFEDFKKQMMEMATLLKEQLKIKQVSSTDAPPESSSQGNGPTQEAPKSEQPKKMSSFPKDENTDDLHKKMKQMEEAIRSMRGIGSFGSVNYSDLCIFSGTRYPKKFKMPEFEKYNGAGDPYTHLKVYIGELGAYAEDESLRMQLFQKSLTGDARTWYARLDNARIHNWEELAHAFLSQYNFQSLMAPDRYQMTKIKKQPKESFREYAQRWRRLAAQVNPPMDENEMVMTFIDIQEAPYYERVLAGIGKPFAEMIKHGELAEMGLKSGKIRDFTALEAVADQIRAGNYGNAEDDVSLILQGQSSKAESNPPIRMQSPLHLSPPNKIDHD